ncbi:unnamed protein product [Caenorhabditis brenneri]
MKNVLLAALILSNVSCYLYDLSAVTQKCDAEPLNPISEKGFTKYFSIPLSGDVQAEYTSYEIVDGSNGNDAVALDFPASEKVTEKKIADTTEPKICYNDQKYNLNGKLYFVTKAYGDMELYHYLQASYSVPITKNYTTIFSRTVGGSTISNLQTDAQTAFQIYSGLPGEDDTVLYTYDSQLKLDSIFIPEDHFYILNTGSKTWNFSVKDGGEAPKDIKFDGKGFIMTPGFPKMPSEDYLNLNVQLNDRTDDKLIKVQVSLVKALDGARAQQEGIQLAVGDANVKVTVGSEECNFNALEQLSTEECTHFLPKSTNTFNVKSTNAAYTIQFDLEVAPSTTSTTKSPTTTVKPTPAPGGTCAPTTTCPAPTPCTNTTCPVCPTVPVCSCSTSTTEVPTTTMGTSTTTVASLISLLTVYYVI